MHWVLVSLTSLFESLMFFLSAHKKPVRSRSCKIVSTNKKTILKLFLSARVATVMLLLCFDCDDTRFPTQHCPHLGGEYVLCCLSAHPSHFSPVRQICPASCQIFALAEHITFPSARWCSVFSPSQNGTLLYLHIWTNKFYAIYLKSASYIS